MAWITFAEVKKDEALRQMRAAADHEDSTEKLPVTPGAVVPARELLGEMLLEAKQPELALAAFETSLQLTPGRYNSLYGAARAAQLAGDRRKAASFYTNLLANCQRAEPSLLELREARLFLGRK